MPSCIKVPIGQYFLVLPAIINTQILSAPSSTAFKHNNPDWPVPIDAALKHKSPDKSALSVSHYHKILYKSAPSLCFSEIKVKTQPANMKGCIFKELFSRAWGD